MVSLLTFWLLIFVQLKKEIRLIIITIWKFRIKIDIGICGDARLAAESISGLLGSTKIECLSNAQSRISEATRIKQEWEVRVAEYFNRHNWTLAVPGKILLNYGSTFF